MNKLETIFYTIGAFACLGTGVVIDGSIRAAVILLIVAGAAMLCGRAAGRIGAWR